MSLSLNNKQAHSIFKKLKADIREGTRHTIASLTVDGKEIMRTLISRSSKDSFPIGTAHQIYKDLGIANDKAGALQLRECTMTRDQYLEHLRSHGLLP